MQQLSLFAIQRSFGRHGDPTARLRMQQLSLFANERSFVGTFLLTYLLLLHHDGMHRDFQCCGETDFGTEETVQ